MSEWIGWVGRLRQMIYSRMEELSFRTGFAAVAGVLAVAATAILLTLTQGGHHAALPRAQAVGLASSTFVAAPAIVPLSPSATHHARRPEGGPDVRYAPEPTKAPIARPHPDPSPSPTPKPSFQAPTYGRPNPGSTFSWPFPTSGSGFDQPGRGLPTAGPLSQSSP